MPVQICRITLQIVAIFFLPDTSPVCAHEEVAAEVKSVPELAATIKRSLVAVKVVGRDGSDASYSTGFVISSDGLIATALHSIAEGHGISVVATDGTELQVTHVHARLPAADLVVLRVNSTSLEPLKIAESSEVQDGAAVVAVGHPRGRRNSVVTGLVSRREEIEGVEMLQLSMPVDRGSSGEPVVSDRGEVIGIVTLKSSIQENTGYAVPAVHLRRMLQDPAPIPIARWKTIGQLDPAAWTILMGANWRRQGTNLVVSGYGMSFGGRSLCLSTRSVPKKAFDVRVDVKLDDNNGAAGLAFHSDGGDTHYGFYPSAGKLRVTRFRGPELSSWTILYNEVETGYAESGWNTLKVRAKGTQFEFYLNGLKIYSMVDDRLQYGRVGLVTFRGTRAQFRRFAVADSIPSVLPDEESASRIELILNDISSSQPAHQAIVDRLQPYADYSSRVLEKHASELEARARRIRQLANDVHASEVRRELMTALGVRAGESGSTSPPDLLRACLLVAKLDNPDVDIDSCILRVDALAEEVLSMCRKGSAEIQRLEQLDRVLFEEYGYRGSRFEYYSRDNSYLNQVINDREGLPIALSVLYMSIASRLELNLKGLGLPGHFIVVRPADDDTNEPIYIDVFHQGRRLSTEDVDNLILSQGGKPDPQYLEPQTPVQIVDRMLRNLLRLAEERREDDRIYRYMETLAMLNPEDAEYRVRRMLIRAQTGRFQAAIEDVNSLIAEGTPGANVDRFYELRAEFQRRIERLRPTR